MLNITPQHTSYEKGLNGISMYWSWFCQKLAPYLKDILLHITSDSATFWSEVQLTNHYTTAPLLGERVTHNKHLLKLALQGFSPTRAQTCFPHCRHLSSHHRCIHVGNSGRSLHNRWHFQWDSNQGCCCLVGNRWSHWDKLFYHLDKGYFQLHRK